MATAIEHSRQGGAIGRVGVPHYEGIPALPAFYGNLVARPAEPAPVRGSR